MATPTGTDHGIISGRPGGGQAWKRRPAVATGRPCRERHPDPFQTCDSCGACLLYVKRPDYRARWDGHPLPLAPAPARPATSRRFAPTPCVHLGPPTGESRPCPTCTGTVMVELRTCSLRGVCTETKLLPQVACCHVCPDRQALPRPPMRWVSTADLVRDAIRLAAMLPPDVSAIAGVPRSGMIPASVIATHLHLPLWELPRGGPLRQLGAGSRGGSLYRPSGPIAVVDDTVYGGGAMARARDAMRGRRALYCAVYCRPESRDAADLFAAELSSPHILEWNLANNGPFAGHAADPVYGQGVACDLDGVLVHDDQSGGPTGTSYLVPRAHPVRLIVTGRPERARGETEGLLRRLGVRWERLEMLEDSTPLTEESAAAHKARHYAASRCGFFLESCPIQAELIFKAASKPVICPRAGKVWQ